MAATGDNAPRAKVTVPSLLQAKHEGRRIAMITAYDATFAAIADDAGVDVLLVGDSVATVMQGERTTLPVSLEEMAYHTRIVAAARPKALVERFMTELQARRFHLGGLVLNRTLPDSLIDPASDAAATVVGESAGVLATELAGTGIEALGDPARTERVLATVAESFGRLAVVAKREAELRAELARTPDVTVRVPNLAAEVGDVESLRIMGRALFDTPVGRSAG